MQINQLLLQDPAYPGILHQIYDPPERLYVQGQLSSEFVHVAIVGTRRSTAYGRRIAFDIASELARAGLVIVSGLAEGIDTMAHEGALAAGGLTVAVQGRGLNDVYPEINRDLARRIVAGGGAIISEYEPKVPAFKWNFPKRNRIVAGLCQGVIVVESGDGGGSMLTVNEAKNENRVVMAVPGDVTREVSAGCNNLIYGGAHMVRNATDVLIALGLNDRAIPLARPVMPQSAQEATIMELLKRNVETSQDLIEESHFTAPEFANIISLMEITGKVRNLGAGRWAARK